MGVKEKNKANTIFNLVSSRSSKGI
uniref:Uncharacterized protein n=1 Tax=Anguilla anguilla TaxID=7936 RepID=A0A0E9PW00_ANGAN